MSVTFNNTYTRLLAGTALAVTLGTAPAMAQNVVSGHVGFAFSTNQSTSINTKRLETSLGTTLQNGLGFQFDIAASKYEAFTSTSPAATLHMYYKPGDWAVGAFLTAEDRRPGNSYYFGLEAAYTSGPWEFEGYWAYRDDIAATTDGSRIGILASYAPENWNGFGLMLGGHSEDGMGTGTKSYAYLGGQYRTEKGMVYAAQVGQTDQGDTIFSVNLKIEFGEGAVFSRRDSRGVFPGY